MSRVIDATNLKVGRLATVVAKAALGGEEIVIINSEKAVISGDPDYTYHKYKAQHDRGRPTKGPFQPRMPDRFLRRIIRSMLPYKTPRGRDALHRVMCYIGNPTGAEAESLPAASIEHSGVTKFITVGALCNRLGGKSF